MGPSDQTTTDLRTLCRHREELARQRSQVAYRIHSILQQCLIAIPTGSGLFDEPGRAFVRGLALAPNQQFVLDQRLLWLESLETQISEVDRFLANATADCEPVQLLLSIPGVGIHVATGVAAAVGQIERFPTAKHLVSYLGLESSGRGEPGGRGGSGRNPKRKRPPARRLLVEAATVAVQIPGPPQSLYLRLHAEKGHELAVVAVARQFACLVWHLLTTGQPYAWEACPPDE